MGLQRVRSPRTEELDYSPCPNPDRHGHWLEIELELHRRGTVVSELLGSVLRRQYPERERHFD